MQPLFEIQEGEKRFKQLPKELITKFLKSQLPVISNRHNNQCTVGNSDGIYTAVIHTTGNSDAFLSVINSEISDEMDVFIEKETGDDRGDYNRSAVLYESTAQENMLFLRWS
jgi:hypothetical protein